MPDFLKMCDNVNIELMTNYGIIGCLATWKCFDDGDN